MTKSTITRERAQQIFLGNGPETSASEERELARMALSAMDGDPVIVVGDDGGDALSYRRLIQSFEPGTKLYRHAQPLPVVNGEYGDAYQGAREDLAIWKRRALEAEESVRRLEQINDHLVKEAQGESRMGEPVIAQPAPVVPEDFDFNRFNDVVWLECVASNPHMHSPTTSAIARVALELNKRSATMEAEPVAYTDEEELNFVNDMACMWTKGMGINEVPLYRHAQPALVIPDEMTAEQAYEIGYYYGDPVNVFARGANWMRQHIIDSTLAAAPHDTPALNSVQSVVTVPGKWIPVSERMPEVGVKVLCFPVEDEPIHATFNGQLWLQDVSWSGSDEPIDNVIPTSVTHWMPLPAGPQGVK